ncbi:DUF305 domain-containing protein [Pseudonocardia nigra]|uniref:DUF305 domain-containing protein n=1 Tax=Pseudonocardia nigra TaxID=1921578 RepID=UPI001C5E0E57|nr:DUF305 domain-containing protein [Pseudonocardia nigra]
MIGRHGGLPWRITGRPRRTSAVAVLALALALVGGSQALAHDEGDDRKGGEHPSATDARWAAMMIPHHRTGIELTELALEKSENDGVRDLAAESRHDQQRELPKLEKVARAGGLEPMPPEKPIRRFNEQQMEKLRELSGPEFDRAWLDVFSGHHVSAIMMSDVALAGTAGGLAEKLQEQIHDVQLEQLARMNELREEVGEG